MDVCVHVLENSVLEYLSRLTKASIPSRINVSRAVQSSGHTGRRPSRSDGLLGALRDCHGRNQNNGR